MARQTMIMEINAPQDKVWNLLSDPKEFAFWAPSIRDLTLEPKDKFDVDTIRHIRLDVTGKIETLDMRITHFNDGEMFAETPCGGSMGLHQKCSIFKLVYRVEAVDAKTCSFSMMLDYEMKGLLNQLLEKVIMGTFTSQLRLWSERLKTYAETGRPV